MTYKLVEEPFPKKCFMQNLLKSQVFGFFSTSDKKYCEYFKFTNFRKFQVKLIIKQLTKYF